MVYPSRSLITNQPAMRIDGNRATAHCVPVAIVISGLVNMSVATPGNVLVNYTSCAVDQQTGRLCLITDGFAGGSMILVWLVSEQASPIPPCRQHIGLAAPADARVGTDHVPSVNDTRYAVTPVKGRLASGRMKVSILFHESIILSLTQTAFMEVRI